MSNRGFDNSPRAYSSSPRGYSPYSVSNRRYGNGPNQPGYSPSAWGSSQGQYTPRRPSMSPRHHQFSPRLQGFSDSLTPSNYRQSSPREHQFKTPNTNFIPFSPPNSGGYRGRGSGRKSYKTFQITSSKVTSSGNESNKPEKFSLLETHQQRFLKRNKIKVSNQRKDKSCNPGGSQNIEDYYHPEMLQDPWKFCSPVPVSKA